MPLESPVADFMADAPALSLSMDEPPAPQETPSPVAPVSGITNADRRLWDKQLLALGWKRTVVRVHDPETGEETGKIVRYFHADHPNDGGDGWTQATALLMSGLATGRVKVEVDAV